MLTNTSKESPSLCRLWCADFSPFLSWIPASLASCHFDLLYFSWVTPFHTLSNIFTNSTSATCFMSFWSSYFNLLLFPTSISFKVFFYMLRFSPCLTSSCCIKIHTQVFFVFTPNFSSPSMIYPTLRTPCYNSHF